jgi:hypothetical protein
MTRAKKTADSAPAGDLTDAELVRQALRAILQDDTAGAQARATAARTLAEMAGAMGRHSEKPTDPTRRLADLSRAELERELAASVLDG